MKLFDLLNEQSIGYTPEKMDHLITEANAYVIKFKKLYNSTYSFVVNLTIRECLDDMDQMRSKLNQLNQFKVSINSKYDHYYNILDTFEIGEYPNNVKEFDNIITEIDRMMQDYDNLLDAFKDIISNSEYISR